MCDATFQGQITFRRALSKKIVFYDLLCAGSDSKQAAGQCQVLQDWVEVVVKEDVYGSVQNVKDLRDRLKLGDVVIVSGTQESNHILLAVHVEVVQPWCQQHPGVAFKPQPSPQNLQRQRQVQALKRRENEAAQPNSEPPAQEQQQAEAGIIPSLQSVLCAVEGQTAAPPNTSIAAEPAAMEGRVEAAQGHQPGVCKYWVNTGQCAKGAACPYPHLQSDALRQRWWKHRDNERRLLSSSQGFVHNASVAAKRCRAQVFAAWLVKTYGKEVLSAGAGVLDVAGGAGSVTFELAVVHGIKCTLVDPRPLKLTKHQHRQLQQAALVPVIHTLTQQQLLQEQAEGLEALGWGSRQAGQLGVAAAILDGQGQSTEDAARPGTAAGFKAGAASADAAEGPSLFQQRLQQQQGKKESQHQQLAEVHLWQVQAWFGPQLWQSPGWQRLFGRSSSGDGSSSSSSSSSSSGSGGFSLLVGLHPDQATEPILDLALHTGRPFAMMPCCVFPRLFPHRRLPSSVGSEGHEQGQPVSTYPQLLEYVAGKGQAHRCVLGFEGANTVVYRT